ncbi:mannan endo-1,4-beta-mannosidase 4-like [Carya illinoinensis]|uniref:mannan endo-1,4-beta-mannosidase 4-like n=1 Tax=Carya illinoinensis TaxID=32201 RepID=UPI001C720D3B|nr:mannan endo-1,4-beta-mannosidase 4-like [Carya illinoinensis]
MSGKRVFTSQILKYFIVIVLLVLQGNFGSLACSSFVRTEGTHFVLNGKSLYLKGFNAYWMMYMASDPSTRAKVSTAFQQASENGMNVARTWAFSDGGFRPLQSSSGLYNEDVFSTVLTRKNSITKMLYKDDPFIFVWELINEPHCQTDPSGRFIQEWVTEMAAYVKSIDENHLLEIGLEGFYGKTTKQMYNPGNLLVGTDFISNNQLPQADFATIIHLYPEQWLAGSNDEVQAAFVDKWNEAHIEDSKSVLNKPLILGEFGKSSKLAGYSLERRDHYFSKLYNAIYTNARSGGPFVGGIFWQRRAQGMDNFRDGYEVVLEDSHSTARVIALQSHLLSILP